MGQVIRILDGPLAPIACVSKTAYQKCLDCPYTKKAYCPLQHVMGDVRNAIADILDHYSLEDFISGSAQIASITRAPCDRWPVLGELKHAFA